MTLRAQQMVTPLPCLHNKLLLWQRPVADPSCVGWVYLLPLAVAVGSSLPAGSVLEGSLRLVSAWDWGVWWPVSRCRPWFLSSNTKLVLGPCYQCLEIRRERKKEGCLAEI